MFLFSKSINLIIPHHLSLFITTEFLFCSKKKKIPLGHLIPSLHQLAIAIYLQGLLPPANAICGSHEHIQSCFRIPSQLISAFVVSH